VLTLAAASVCVAMLIAVGRVVTYLAAQ